MKSDLFKQQTRQFPEAIDSTLVFNSRSEAENYAKTCPTAYSGQILAYLAGDEQKPAIVQPDKSLKDIEGVGPKGDKGDKGDDGMPGAKGDKGDAGAADIQSGSLILAAGENTTTTGTPMFQFYRIAKMMYIKGRVACSKKAATSSAWLMGLPQTRQDISHFPLSFRVISATLNSEEFSVHALNDFIEISARSDTSNNAVLWSGNFEIYGWYELR